MAKIKPSVRPTETYTESNFLRVHTYSRPRERVDRLVTIEHLSYTADPSGEAGSGWRCETIVDGEPMSGEDALFIAETYAQEHDIPVIYECHSE